MYYVYWGSRPLFIKYFKFIFPLLFIGKYVSYYYAEVNSTDFDRSFQDLTNNEKMDALLINANVILDIVSVLAIILIGHIIDGKIKIGRELEIFATPFHE